MSNKNKNSEQDPHERLEGKSGGRLRQRIDRMGKALTRMSALPDAADVDWQSVSMHRDAQYEDNLKWQAARKDQLRNLYGDRLGEYELEERVKLELMCRNRDKVPARGIDLKGMRAQGFRFNAYRNEPMTGDITVMTQFPEGWNIAPDGDDGEQIDIRNTSWATITDPDGLSQYHVYYRWSPGRDAKASIGPMPKLPDFVPDDIMERK
jgi:hypothetical protein